MLRNVNYNLKRKTFSSLYNQKRHFLRYVFPAAYQEHFRKQIDGTSDEKKLGDYIRILAQNSPKDAITQIERGWETGKLPVSELIVREYFKAAATLKKLDSVNISGILGLMSKSNVNGNGG